MLQLVNWDKSDPDGLDHKEATAEQLKTFISTQLATTLSDDVDFLRKINKLTFGLQSTQ